MNWKLSPGSLDYVTSSPFPEDKQPAKVWYQHNTETSIRGLSLASEAVVCDIVSAGAVGSFLSAVSAGAHSWSHPHCRESQPLMCLGNLQGWIKTGLRRPSLFSSRPAFQLSKLHFVCCVNRCLYEGSSSGSLLEAPALIWRDEEAFTSWVGNQDKTSVRQTPLVLNSPVTRLPSGADLIALRLVQFNYMLRLLMHFKGRKLHWSATIVLLAVLYSIIY